MLSKKSIPNIVSFVRLLGIPGLLFFLISGPNENRFICAGLFLLLAATDLLDGFLARKLDAESDIGAMLDPLIDKLLILSPLIVLVGVRSSATGESWVPSWLVVLLLAREVWITGLRGFAATKGISIPAGEVGKVKTFFQVVAVFFLLLHNEQLLLLGDEWITAQYVGLQSLLTAILLAYWSGVEYTVAFLRRNALDQERVHNDSVSTQPKRRSHRLNRRA
ncbi:MAG: CDP-diacylglycerol--glycerol-3-phosphate 3-phosphatidyltransferase [Bdellovibrionales bacterium]|nr:CDP-diacylglycerol--glycerol-3-phosphate 3-phosphatidyltransferase [Bdellovibrionales bacterium]